MGFHRVEDGQIYFEFHNPSDREGPGVLFLHGLGSCSEDWGLQIPIVRERYWVLALDMPGHGRSSQPSGWPSIEEMALQIASVVKEQAESPVHVVGLSLGGAVAMQLAIAHPEAVRSLTLVNTFARLHSGSSGFFRKLVRIAFVVLGQMDRVGQWVAAGLFPEPEQELLRQAAAERIASNPRGAYLRAIWAATRFDIRDRLNEIDTPTLVVAGELDTTVSMSAKKELAGHIPGAHLVVIPDSGHATPIDAAEEFNQTLLDFLSKLDIGQRGAV
ncbi:MAG: alpha/beta hydrolase [Anaerolineales bacterium]|nr:alpha/beta hydrolase [Anaerolineales bacterium]